MRIIALNGFGYDISKFLAPEIETPYRHWSRFSAKRLSASIKEATTLIGFSSGATAALRIAMTNPYVKAAYIHSARHYRGPMRVRPKSLTFFYTHGDHTPANYKAALFNRARAEEVEPLGPASVFTIRLTPEPFVAPTFFERHILIPSNHQFHNCLQCLPPEWSR